MELQTTKQKLPYQIKYMVLWWRQTLHARNIKKGNESAPSIIIYGHSVQTERPHNLKA